MRPLAGAVNYCSNMFGDKRKCGLVARRPAGCSPTYIVVLSSGTESSH